LYPVTPTERRKSDRTIMLSHIANFVPRGWPFPPDLRNRTTYHALPELREFYRERREFRHMPFHYYACMIKGEWEVFATAPEDIRMPILSDAANEYYLPDRFRDALLICVQDNYSLNTPDPRLWQVLAYHILEPRLDKISRPFRDAVSWWDEEFNWEKFGEDQLTDERNAQLTFQYPWEVQRMKYFDRTIFNLETIKYL
jgi:hypothetical protein